MNSYISAWKPLSEAPKSDTVIVEERCSLYIGDFIDGEWMIHDVDGPIPASKKAKFVAVQEELHLDRAVQYIIAQAFGDLVSGSIEGFKKKILTAFNPYSENAGSYETNTQSKVKELEKEISHLRAEREALWNLRADQTLENSARLRTEFALRRQTDETPSVWKSRPSEVNFEMCHAFEEIGKRFEDIYRTKADPEQLEGDPPKPVVIDKAFYYVIGLLSSKSDLPHPSIFMSFREGTSGISIEFTVNDVSSSVEMFDDEIRIVKVPLKERPLKTHVFEGDVMDFKTVSDWISTCP